MDIATLTGLGALALIDSTSFGTLGLPVLMLAQRQVNRRAYVVYLLTICPFYLGLGLVLLAGVRGVRTLLDGVSASPAIDGVQLAFGAILLVGSFFIGKGPEGATRRNRWSTRVAGPDPDLRAVVGVALAAGLTEAASMLPYLAAIGIVSAATVTASLRVLILVGYVAVMGMPALVLLAARLAVAQRAQPALDRLARWIEKASGETLAWIIGIVGFLLARDALARLAAAGTWPFGG